MRFGWRWLVALGVLLASAQLEAQIYMCTAKDGTRIFSDQRCGPDAKVVPNITTRKKPSNPAPRPKPEQKSPEELDALLEKCNAGDLEACNVWTRSGGPNSLREKEQAAEQACAAGSLADCERRYCGGNVSDQCRARVLQTAKVAGETWYLRDAGQVLPDGSTRYQVVCVPPGAPMLREVSVTCSGTAGPNRCASSGNATGFPRLDAAAAALCRN
ncbi:MAG TPA: DUF4124 domain-containing protein [Steroidobacteraceae bacterium]